MSGHIFRPDEAPAFDTNERCHIVEVANSSIDPEVSIALASVAVGVTTAWHRLRDTTERYLIQSGQGEVEVQGMPATQVGPGDVVYIPADAAQRIRNTGDTILRFHAICTPPFTPDCYRSLES